MINELFFWCVDNTHYLLGPYKRNEIDQVPNIENIAVTDGYPANKVLPRTLLKYLEKNLDHPNTTIRLYLHWHLSASWQHLNWENLSLNGKALNGHLQIIRYAQFEPFVSVKKQKKWLMLNHWEDNTFSSALQSDCIDIKPS